MFLTKKGLRKILIMAICYFVVGSTCIIIGVIFRNTSVYVRALFILGAIAYLLDIILVFCGKYAEGEGKLINSGNKLVRKELKPADFIKEYELLKNSNDLVIKKPSIECLQLVMIAYDSLDDKENCLATADEMIAVAGDKKKAYATLLKVSLLFSYDKTEQAEKLFDEARKLKLDFICNALTDAIFKSGRAMAMGDYKIAEEYNLKLLERRFPKLDNLSKLGVHYMLGEIYEKMQDNEKAVSYYQHCASHGGETAIKTSAMSAIKRLQNA